MKNVLLFILLLSFPSIIYGTTESNIETEQFTSDLYHFHINPSEPFKIYFDSRVPISEVTIANFKIIDNENNHVIASAINGGTLNHSLTVKKAFFWYHNNTISYSGDNVIGAFQLQFIQNNIQVPIVTGTEYFVDASVDVSGTGLDEDTPFKTIQEGVNILKAGDKLWIRAGNYGDERVVVNNSGNISNPIHIEGYIKTQGDITKMYYSYGNGELKANKMPLLIGTDRAKYNGFMLEDNVHDIVIKNLQIKNYRIGFFSRINTKRVRLERILVKDMGDWENGGEFAVGIHIETWDTNKCNYFRVKDCIVINAEKRGISSKGDNNYYENCKVYSDEFDIDYINTKKKATDYYFKTNGTGNIIRGCEANKKTSLGHNGHAFALKHFNEYNLVENCLAVNTLWSYQARHSVTRFNVFRNSEAHADVPYRLREQYRPYTGGINVNSGASYNIFENIYIHDTDVAFMFDKFYDEGGVSPGIGHHNTFKNIVINNIVHYVFYFRNGEKEKTTVSFNDNKFYNLTINKVNYQELPVTDFQYDNGKIFGGFYAWFPNERITTARNSIENTIINDVPTINYSDQFPLGFDWDTNNFYNSFEAQGNHITEDNPKFVDVDTQNFHLKASSTLISAGKTIAEVFYDKDGLVRISPTSVGAYQFINGALGNEEIIGPAADKFLIYPNPNQGLLTIGLTNTKRKEAFEIVVYSINGRLVYANTIENNTTKTLNLSHLTKGIYILKASSNSKSFTQKIVLQ